ncbi:MAG TPA: TfoX/Sxy family protein [Rhizomicrobium sp.]|nr:TfoX/Sxy family protein [Rhizomicrobium sp.]
MKRGSGRSPKLAAFGAQNGPQDHSVRLRRTASHPSRFDDLFQFFGRVSIRRMFGGEGLYAEDVMIGLVAGETLYLKTGDHNRADFLAEGCVAFSFPRGEKMMVTSYYAVPERLLDDPEEFAAWARKAHAAALAPKLLRRKSR